MKIWRLGLGMGLERTWNYRKPWGRRFERISAALEDHQCLVTFFFFNMIFFVVVVQSLSRVGLWDPMDCSLPGSPVLCYLPEFAQIYIHWAGSQWCYLTIWSCHPFLLLPSLFCSIRDFFIEFALHLRCPQHWSFSFSKTVLPMTVEGWFPLGLTDILTSLHKFQIGRFVAINYTMCNFSF